MLWNIGRKDARPKLCLDGRSVQVYSLMGSGILGLVISSVISEQQGMFERRCTNWSCSLAVVTDGAHQDDRPA